MVARGVHWTTVRSAGSDALERQTMVDTRRSWLANPWMTCCLAAGLVLAAPFADARAATCPVADLGGTEILLLLQRLARPVLVHAPSPSRWLALVPQQVGLTVQNGERASLGWTETLTTSSDRFSLYASWAVALRFSWDLKDLVRPALPEPVPTTEQRLQWALHTESLASRLSVPLRQLRRAQLLAATVESGDPACADAQADAEAALLVLQAVRIAAQPVRPAGL